MIASSTRQQIGIITDRPMFRSEITDFVESQGSVEITRVLTHAQLLTNSFGQLPPITICDLYTSKDSALPAIFHLMDNRASTEVVYVLRDEGDTRTSNILRILCRLRAKACLSSDTAPPQILDAVERVVLGQTIICNRLQENFPWQQTVGRDEPKVGGPLQPLTLRQIQILSLLATGLTVQQVAGQLHLSPRTVESHKYHMMKTLNCNCLVSLCRFAIRHGLIVA